jgi:hypothetical protein
MPLSTHPEEPHAPILTLLLSHFIQQRQNARGGLGRKQSEGRTNRKNILGFFLGQR